MGLVKCDECGCDLSPKNFHEVERIKTGEEIAICNKCYNGFVKSGRLKHVDEDGNVTHGERSCGLWKPRDKRKGPFYWHMTPDKGHHYPMRVKSLSLYG